jgi:hypothetical protein
MVNSNCLRHDYDERPQIPFWDSFFERLDGGITDFTRSNNYRI